MRKGFANKVVLGTVLALLIQVNVLAAGGGKVVGTYTNEDDISLYVKGLDSDISEVDCQIGTKSGQQVAVENVVDMENPPKTLIMIDNSLSISKSNREKIYSFLTGFVERKSEPEQIAIATFDQELNVIVNYTSDSTLLGNAIDFFTYQDQETYLTDVLYDVISGDQLGTEDCYRRIIIISDGVDNKAIGYTKDELYALVKDKAYPIYTIGCVNKSNEEQLENMFALSRMTEGRSFLLDEEEDTGSVVEQIAEDDHVIHFNILPGTEEMDGSSKSILLTIRSAEGEQRIEATVKMPFRAQQEDGTEASEEIEPTEEPSAIPASAMPENVGEAKQDGIPVLYVGIGAAVVIGLFVIALIVMIFLHKKLNKKQESDFEVLPDAVHPKVDTGTEITELVSGYDGDKTQMIWGGAAKRYTLYLTDVKNPGRTFQMPIEGTVIIGRKAGDASLVIDCDRSLSGKHCQISERNGKFYVRDLQSSNGTLLNGVRILAEMEICSGSVLTLGRLEMRVEIRCE